MTTSTDVFMARQPIYDRNLELYAYELLYRRGGANSAEKLTKAEDAQSMVNVLVDIGLNQLAGNTKAFINVSEDLLLSGSLTSFPKSQVVLELLETIKPNQEVIARARHLRDCGYSIALDDFVLSPDMQPLVQLADIIKIDVASNPDSELRRLLGRLRRPNLQLLAEKVETYEQYRSCRDIGFDLFQGYFFARPELMKGNRIPANKLALLRLTGKLQSQDIQFDELDEIISSDIALSYRLLKFVKSAHFGLPGTITSVKQALLFLGVNTVLALTTLLTMSSCSDKPGELLTSALVRAKMCELLAAGVDAERKDRYFTTGMLSVLDALMDAPMEELLKELPLSEEINEALLIMNCRSDLALTLRKTVAFEQARWDDPSLDGSDLNAIAEKYRVAVKWATESNDALAA